MATTQKAAVIAAKGKLEIHDGLPLPKLGPFECLCRITACSICNGTDRKLIEGKIPVGKYPSVLGHEGVGEIVEVGEGVKNLAVGDVVLRPTLSYDFGESDYGSAYGGFAEWGKCGDLKAAQEAGYNAIKWGWAMNQKLPRGFDPVHATQLITLKEALSTIHKLGIGLGTSVVVMGTGPVGLAFIQFAKLLGAGPVICVGRREAALERALAEGADFAVNNQTEDVPARVKALTGGAGADLALDAVGDFDLIRLGLQCIKAGGAVRMYGVPEPDEEGVLPELSIPVYLGPMDWQVGSIYPDEPLVHDWMLSLVKQGKVDPGRHVTHSLPLEELATGFELLAKREALKVVALMQRD